MRFVSVDNAAAELNVTAVETPLQFSALHFTDEQLEAGLTKAQRHTSDLTPLKKTILTIDLLQKLSLIHIPSPRDGLLPRMPPSA